MAEQAYAYVTLIPVAKGFKSAITKELNGVDNVGKTAGDKAGNGFTSGFKKALTGLTIVAGAAAATLGGVLASGFQRLSGIEEAQAKLVGLGNSTESVSLIMENALSAVRGTAFGMADAATIAASAVAAGVAPGEELAKYLKTTADAAYIAGAGLDEMGSILNKATTTGKAGNDVLTQLAERGIPIYQMLADQAGVAATEVFDLASQGEISSEMLMNALEGNLGGAALESGNTVAGAFANMKASIQRVGANLLGPSFGYFKDFFLGIIAFLEPVEEKAKVVGQVIGDFLGEKLIPYFENLFLIGEVLGADNVFAKVFEDIKTAVVGFFQGGQLESAFETLSELRLTIFNAILKAVPGILDAFIEFLPTLIDFFVNTMLPEMIAQFQTILNEVISLITRLLPGLITSLVGMIPDLLNAAIELFNALVQAVIDITPDLVDAIIYLLPEIVNSVLSMLPQLIDAALQLFTAIVEAVPQILPPLITALIDLLPVIIDTLIEMLPQLIDAAFDLFSGIITAVFDATPEIMGAIGELLPKIVETLLGFIPRLFEIAGDVIGGFVSGIIEKGPKAIGDALSGVLGGAIEGVKGLLGIRSPSTVFRGIGVNVGEGMAQGIDSQADSVATAAENLGDVAVNAASKTVEAIEAQFTTISSIPGILSTAVEETFQLSMAQVRKMAEETAGMFAVFNEAGDLVQSYSGYGENPLNDAFNSILKYQGTTSVAGINKTAEALFGGSMQQVLDAINPNPQATLVDPRTGMQRTIGAADEESLALAIGRAVADGFQLTQTIQTPIEELNKTIDDLIETVAREGLTPFANGGLVTGPTSALIGEAGPEVVIPLDRFESMMGMSDSKSKTVNYYAAPNQSIDSEQELFQAMRRAKVVANW